MSDNEMYEVIFETDILRDICKSLRLDIDLLDIDILIDKDKFGICDDIYRLDIMDINKLDSITNKSKVSYVYKLNIFIPKYINMTIDEFVNSISNLLIEIKKDYTALLG